MRTILLLALFFVTSGYAMAPQKIRRVSRFNSYDHFLRTIHTTRYQYEMYLVAGAISIITVRKLDSKNTPLIVKMN